MDVSLSFTGHVKRITTPRMLPFPLPGHAKRSQADETQARPVSARDRPQPSREVCVDRCFSGSKRRPVTSGSPRRLAFRGDRQRLLSDKGPGYLVPGAGKQPLHRTPRYPHAHPRPGLIHPLAVAQMQHLQFIVGERDDFQILERRAGRLEDRRVAGPVRAGADSRFAWPRHG